MATEWFFEGRLDRVGAKRVCERSYETLDDLVTECQQGDWEYDSPLMILAELRRRLEASLPFDPEVPS